MKSITIACMFVLFISAIGVWAGSDFARYAGILERRPFAPVTSLDDKSSEVVTLEEPPAFVKDLRMCAITESPAGMRVGFINIRSKPPQPYYLYVGDSEDGIQLVSADYEKEGALLRKGGEQYWLYMRGDAAPVAGNSDSDNSEHNIVTARRGSRGAAAGVVRSEGGVSYAERRRHRLEEMRKKAETTRQLSEEEVEKKLQEYQMDLIRKGLTPLPIPLTKEMDDQLVKEGILPPAEVVE